MQLIGMLDSPYVRRTAISLHLLDVPFEHRSLSVFRDFDAFRAVNPLVKAPTLVCDDGAVLVDSGLIIGHAETLAGRSLLPHAPEPRREALRQIGLALTVAEKAVQIVYEGKRDESRRDPAWLARVTGQLQSACALLEAELGRLATPWLHGDMPNQADISVAVAWGFVQLTAPERIVASAHPALTAFAARAERLPAFRAWPIDG